VPCLQVLKRMRRVDGRIVPLFPCQLNKYFLSILFVLSSFALPKTHTWPLPSVNLHFSCGRKTNVCDKFNVMRHNLVLNCKMQKNAITEPWGMGMIG